ncbi:MAG: SAM-dependent chlorinase/fluorinase [candidate division KSB1 bacterium]|nr:SAM-dependent chlorinase/fluorinase [candidate division KSB1 bacterium]MDZ7393097.1 SAM-dependent chlorinase/fluorinase [candidate division KSB1 bacterium]MDZ7412431.1 SAM-dependent chlorinase/fluorinase [candidate division KSB1 bacterium]
MAIGNGDAKEPSGIVTLLTDFGTVDAFVGVMKGVILGINPEARLVDLTHEIPAHDVEAAAFVLQMAYPYFPHGTVHLVVVDPGVGSRRRAIAVQAGAHLFVAPDNGVLSWVLARESRWEAVLIERQDLFLPEVSATFHGRDVFAPVAGHLSRGLALRELGPAIPELVRTKVPQPSVEGTCARGEIVYFDRFGNAVTNLPRHLVPPHADLTIAVGSFRIQGLVSCYDEGTEGMPMALWGSAGYLELALRRDNLRARLGLVKGQKVYLQW